jgi:hypothetical protein
MHKVSRTLLLAGVMAFGTLTVACGGDTVVTPTPVVDAVQSVTVSPSNASINVGATITLASNVTSTGNAAKTVTWTSSSSAIATVDATGKVTGVSAGTATIIATSTADASKSAAAAILVNPTAPVAQPSVAIASVTQNGAAVNLSNANGQIDIAVNNSGGGQIDVYLSTSCSTNTISASDVPAATQQTTSAQPGTVVLSVNTAAVTASNAPRFPNGNYCIKARLTSGTTVVVATNTTPITLNNANQFKATTAFTSITGGPTSAVSSLNGLNYNQGTLTVTLNPIVFTSSSPITLISGYLTRNGQIANAAPAPPVNAVFTNVAVTAGVANIVFTDTVGAVAPAAGNRSLRGYTSTPAGDTLYITSATDAAGNPITVTGGLVAVSTGSGIRIDNDSPNLAAAYQITAPNGYIGAAYTFAATVANGGGVTNPAANDVRGGLQGVGGVTTKFYVGAAGAAAFTPANSCNITGLTAATTGTDLANTTNTTTDQAKVVVSDALGNQSCTNVFSSQAPAGTILTFGVDKILPLAQYVSGTGTNTGAAANTGYNALPRNFSVQYQDSISGFSATPLTGTITRNFYGTGNINSITPANTPAAQAECVVGTFNTTTFACDAAPITFNQVINAATPPALIGSKPIEGGTGVVGYYTMSAVAIDQALNVSGPALVRTVAFDNVAPAIGALTQSPAAVAPLGTVTVSGAATDGLNLTTSKGHLINANVPTAGFASVTGNVLGTFGQFVTSATATVALPNVYRGIQSTTGGVINANSVGSSATITVTDVGTNTATSAALPITITSPGAPVNILTGAGFTTPVQFTLASSATSGSATANAATTTLTAAVIGASADVAFQSQPFAQVDYYKCSITSSTTCATGELVLVASVTNAAVTDNPITGIRTYTFQLPGAALSAGTLSGATAAANNVFFAVGRNAAGDAVISGLVLQVNN